MPRTALIAAQNVPIISIGSCHCCCLAAACCFCLSVCLSINSNLFSRRLMSAPIAGDICDFTALTSHDESGQAEADNETHSARPISQIISFNGAECCYLSPVYNSLLALPFSISFFCQILYNKRSTLVRRRFDTLLQLLAQVGCDCFLQIIYNIFVHTSMSYKITIK